MNCRKSGIFCTLLFFTFCLAHSATPSAQENGVTPALPKGYPISVGDTGDVIWIDADYKFGQERHAEYFYNHWNPATGALKKLAVPTNFVAQTAVMTASGLVFLGHESVFPATANLPQIALFLTPQGKAISAGLPLRRNSSHLLALTDQSVLVVGGKLGTGGQRTNAVEHVSLTSGRPDIERLPDLPGVVRTSYALVALRDGRAMALGGSDSKYIGCDSCLADTFVLDLKMKTWGAGPKMVEARANASATLLPDGSVLVAGGWSPGHGWQEGASRSVERWTSSANRFVADVPLPMGVAMHQAMWAAGQQGKQLLLAVGMARAYEDNGAVLDYDVANGIWRTVGENCKADGGNGTQIGSTMLNKQPYMWCETGFRKWKYVPLRLPSSATARLRYDANGVALQRSRLAFQPSQEDGPALAIGGFASGVLTSAVDAIWPDGRIESLIPLKHPRSGARAFTLADGSFLLAGGEGDKPHSRDDDPGALPMEWLSRKPTLSQSQWLSLAIEFDKTTILGQLADGNLIAVKPDGAVEQIVISADSAGTRKAQRILLPPLNRKRRAVVGDESDKVLIKTLPDGRIIVAGGAVQTHSIALLQEDSMQNDAPDKYIGIGEYLPSRRYEIYDPSARNWRNSAPSRGAGGPVAILDDGRVVKLKASRIVGEQKQDGTWNEEAGVLEISHATGDAWNTFGAKAPSLVKLDSHARPFVIQGELFLSGESAAISTGGGPSIVQWFNTATLHWETLWEAPSGGNWRDHVGRIITRTLANGKRVILPVEGL